MLPLAGPGRAAPAILCFLCSWNDFFFALILTRTEAMTTPVPVVNFMNYEGWEWGKIAAGGTMVMLPVLFFSILVRKFLPHGVQSDHLRPVVLVEMAANRITDGLAQSIEIVGLGEDRVAEGASHEAAFRRFFDREDDLARGRSCRHHNRGHCRAPWMTARTVTDSWSIL
jgi:hypothetical protein